MYLLITVSPLFIYIYIQSSSDTKMLQLHSTQVPQSLVAEPMWPGKCFDQGCLPVTCRTLHLEGSHTWFNDFLLPF